jgi:ubiquitin-conjugating enzyme E2 R
MTFTNNYPYSPPTFKFLRPMFHPNIYPDGKLCISILHAPGEDEQSGESAMERWSPLQGVESVLRSVLLLLDDPEVSSPANVDAGVMYRKDRAAYIQKAKQDVEKSKADIPSDFKMPTSFIDAPPTKIEEEAGFWDESDAEDDFGGSDSSGEDAEQEFDEDGDGEQEFDSEDDTKEHKA